MNPVPLLEHQTFYLINEMASFTDQKIKEGLVPFSHYYSHQFAVGISSWIEPRKFCQRFRQLYAKHVTNFSKTIPWSTSLKVLELGAGYLTHGRSRLSCCLPDEVQICYTDISKNAVEDAKEKFPNTTYLQINSSNMSAEITSSSQDVVISSCFLDTLTNEEFTATLAEISRVLKPGGIFFHISDLEPWVNSLVIDNKDDPDVMFPWVEDDRFIRGIQFVPRVICEQFILSDSSGRYSFLKNYIDLTNDIRAAVVIEVCLVKECALFLSRWVKHHFFSSVRKIVNEEFFNQRLRKGLEITHFAVDTLKNCLESSMYSKEEAGEGDYNEICALHGRLIRKTVLRNDAFKDKVRKTLSAHILIARKPHL